jgi:hypothetical protein
MQVAAACAKAAAGLMLCCGRCCAPADCAAGAGAGEEEAGAAVGEDCEDAAGCNVVRLPGNGVGADSEIGRVPEDDEYVDDDPD